MINDQDFFSFNFYLHGIENELIILSTIKELKKDLDDKLKHVYWTELTVKDVSDEGSNTKAYEVNYPKYIINIFEQIRQQISQLKSFKNVGNEILFAGDFNEILCPIQIGKFDNRIHITGDGIPRSIRGLGLGAKIYRALLTKESFITSEDYSLFDFGKLLWNALRKSDLFFTFFTRTHGYCFASDKNPNEIIETLISKINPDDHESILWDSTFLNLHSDKLMNTVLKKLL